MSKYATVGQRKDLPVRRRKELYFKANCIRAECLCLHLQLDFFWELGVDSVVDLCENDEEAEPTNTWLAVEEDEEKTDQVCEEKGTVMTFDLELGVLKDHQWIASIAPLKASPFSEDICVGEFS